MIMLVEKMMKPQQKDSWNNSEAVAPTRSHFMMLSQCVF